VRSNWQIERRFEPRMSADESEHHRRRWNEALRRSRDWEEHG